MGPIGMKRELSYNFRKCAIVLFNYERAKKETLRLVQT